MTTYGPPPPEIPQPFPLDESIPPGWKDVSLPSSSSIPRTLVCLPHIANDPDFRECLEACDKLLTRKGADYTGGASKTGDRVGRLKNFFSNAERLGLTPRQVLGVYMNKHLDAINTFIAKGQLESEPIEGRIHDAVNYLLLLFKMVRLEKNYGGPMTIEDIKEFFDAKEQLETVTP